MTDITQYNWVTVDGKDWGIHLWGELEEYEDGHRQVVEITARYITPAGKEIEIEDTCQAEGAVRVGNKYGIPEEVINTAYGLLDDHKTSDSMLETWGLEKAI